MDSIVPLCNEHMRRRLFLEAEKAVAHDSISNAVPVMRLARMFILCFIYGLIFFNILCSMTVYLISMILYSESFYNVIVDLEVTILILSYFPELLKV